MPKGLLNDLQNQVHITHVHLVAWRLLRFLMFLQLMSVLGLYIWNDFYLLPILFRSLSTGPPNRHGQQRKQKGKELMGHFREKTKETLFLDNPHYHFTSPTSFFLY